MKNSELWISLTENRIYGYREWFRDVAIIPKSIFERHKEHFAPSRNILNNYQNYRSKTLVRHIHAIDRGNIVLVHRDNGNLDRTILLGLLHFVADVIPYGTWNLARRKQKKSVKKKLSELEQF